MSSWTPWLPLFLTAAVQIQQHQSANFCHHVVLQLLQVLLCAMAAGSCGTVLSKLHSSTSVLLQGDAAEMRVELTSACSTKNVGGDSCDGFGGSGVCSKNRNRTLPLLHSSSCDFTRHRHILSHHNPLISISSPSTCTLLNHMFPRMLLLRLLPQLLLQLLLPSPLEAAAAAAASVWRSCPAAVP